LDQSEVLGFCGRADGKLRRLQARLKARIVARGNELRLSGASQDVEQACALIGSLLAAQRAGRADLSERQVRKAVESFEPESHGLLHEALLDVIPVPLRAKRLTPLTATQKRYVDAIRKNPVVFAIGPAGTGKTYLAVGMAVNRLMTGEVGRVILARPAVEAGERLGFLPGDIEAKFNPYVRPLRDALQDMMEPERTRAMIESGAIEIAPLAYMRGRTLNNSFVILDEAQNTTIEQMKMFLTRLGEGSQAVVTGDITQVDLPRGTASGLIHVQKVLADVKGIEFVHFGRRDVVRHPLVQDIVQAYENHG
jgi:phosphate starvation-inducible PhoH-like protein